MRFDEYWIGPAQLALTATLAQSTWQLDGEVIEVGTWQGLSAIPIARAVQPSVLHVVDHWLGDSAPGIDPSLVERDNYGIFLDNLKDARVTNVDVHKMGWREFAKDWDKPIRFLHIDATHSADEVADNIVALGRYVTDGGVICGDDYGFPQVAEGVHRVLHDVNTSEDKFWWVVTGSDSPVADWQPHAHPLCGTRAYSSALAAARELFVVST